MSENQIRTDKKRHPPDPFDDIVVGVVELGLEHLQVADLEARGRKRHLKVHRDRRPGTRHYVF